jgi:hypothetical protein
VRCASVSGCVPGTIELLHCGFADRAKEGPGQILSLMQQSYQECPHDRSPSRPDSSEGSAPAQLAGSRGKYLIMHLTKCSLASRSD